MNIWQIEMERSPYSNTLLFNRNTKLSLSIGLLLLFPALVQGADSLYDQQILQARQGQYAPFLSYLQQYQLRHALTPSQVADWLQVALWAGQDDEVVKVWRRYQVYMPLPARGTAAAAQALRNQKQWQTSLTLWQQALSQAPGSDDYRIGYIKTLADARKDGDTLVIGITDFAQDQLGEILFVDLPDAGASFGADDEFGTVESLKTVSSLYMPVAGEVVERNEALEGKPTLVNLNCYADGWMLRIRPTETPALMTAADYRSQLEG